MILKVGFCPFCGEKEPMPQGGDDEYDQFECAKCGTYMSIRRHSSCDINGNEYRCMVCDAWLEDEEMDTGLCETCQTGVSSGDITIRSIPMKEVK